MGIITSMSSVKNENKRRPTRFDIFVTLCHHGRVKNEEGFDSERYEFALYVASLICPLVASLFRFSFLSHDGNLTSFRCTGFDKLWDELALAVDPCVDLEQAAIHFRETVVKRLTTEERKQLLQAGKVFGFIMMGRS